MADILADARKWLADGPVGNRMGRTHSETCHRWHLECLVERLADEVESLRKRRKPVAWCVQAAAGTMVDARAHKPIDASVLIQCKDEADARIMEAVYGHRRLAVVEEDDESPPRLSVGDKCDYAYFEADIVRKEVYVEAVRPTVENLRKLATWIGEAIKWMERQ